MSNEPQIPLNESQLPHCEAQLPHSEAQLPRSELKGCFVTFLSGNFNLCTSEAHFMKKSV